MNIPPNKTRSITMSYENHPLWFVLHDVNAASEKPNTLLNKRLVFIIFVRMCVINFLLVQDSGWSVSFSCIGIWKWALLNRMINKARLYITNPLNQSPNARNTSHKKMVEIHRGEIKLRFIFSSSKIFCLILVFRLWKYIIFSLCDFF